MPRSRLVTRAVTTLPAYRTPFTHVPVARLPVCGFYHTVPVTFTDLHCRLPFTFIYGYHIPRSYLYHGCLPAPFYLYTTAYAVRFIHTTPLPFGSTPFVLPVAIYVWLVPRLCLPAVRCCHCLPCRVLPPWQFTPGLRYHTVTVVMPVTGWLPTPLRLRLCGYHGCGSLVHGSHVPYTFLPFYRCGYGYRTLPGYVVGSTHTHSSHAVAVTLHVAYVLVHGCYCPGSLVTLVGYVLPAVWILPCLLPYVSSTAVYFARFGSTYRTVTHARVLQLPTLRFPHTFVPHTWLLRYCGLRCRLVTLRFVYTHLLPAACRLPHVPHGSHYPLYRTAFRFTCRGLPLRYHRFTRLHRLLRTLLPAYHRCTRLRLRYAVYTTVRTFYRLITVTCHTAGYCVTVGCTQFCVVALHTRTFAVATVRYTDCGYCGYTFRYRVLPFFVATFCHHIYTVYWLPTCTFGWLDYPPVGSPLRCWFTTTVWVVAVTCVAVWFRFTRLRLYVLVIV